MFIMGRTRRGFTPEYKDEAVKLVINTGRTVATVARELGLKEQTLGRWVHDFQARAAAGEAGQGGLSETERADLLRLRRENSAKAPPMMRCRPPACAAWHGHSIRRAHVSAG
jgi:transposase